MLVTLAGGGGKTNIAAIKEQKDLSLSFAFKTRNSVFLFGIFCYISEILTFLYYANEGKR